MADIYHRPLIERHLQSTALALLVGFGVWNVTELGALKEGFIQLQLKVVVLQTKVESLRDQLKIAASDRFTGSDWALQKDAIMRRIEDLETAFRATQRGNENGL